MSDLAKMLEGLTLLDGSGERWTPVACEQTFLMVSRDKPRQPVLVSGHAVQKLASEQADLRRHFGTEDPR